MKTLRVVSAQFISIPVLKMTCLKIVSLAFQTKKPKQGTPMFGFGTWEPRKGEKTEDVVVSYLRISDLIHYKVWGAIIYPFANINVATVDVGNG